MERLQAVAATPNYQRKDPLLHYMVKTAELHFLSKTVCGSGDWLVTQREIGQSVKDFRDGGVIINQMTKTKRVIYLFMIDDSISEDMA